MASELRAVLDTNVVVAAALSPDGIPATIVSAATARIFKLCLSDSILEEYGEVLTRGKFQFPQEIVASLLADLEAISLNVKPTVSLALTRDPADNKFLGGVRSGPHPTLLWLLGRGRGMRRPYRRSSATNPLIRVVES